MPSAIPFQHVAWDTVPVASPARGIDRRMVVGERLMMGEERIVQAGDVLHFASNVRHGATMMDGEVVLVDIFTPIREDFLPRT